MRAFDTTSEAENVQLEVFRRMGPEKRLQAATQFSQTCRKILMEGIRSRHPDYDERQVRLAATRLMLPEKLAKLFEELD